MKSTNNLDHHSGKDQIVEVLINAGANVNYRDEITHNMALSDAVVGGHEKSVEILLDNGADVNAGFAHDNHTALHSAVAWGMLIFCCTPLICFISISIVLFLK